MPAQPSTRALGGHALVLTPPERAGPRVSRARLRGGLPLSGTITDTYAPHSSAPPGCGHLQGPSLHVHDPVWKLEGRSPKGLSSAKVRDAPRRPGTKSPSSAAHRTLAERPAACRPRATGLGTPSGLSTRHSGPITTDDRSRPRSQHESKGPGEGQHNPLHSQPGQVL